MIRTEGFVLFSKKTIQYLYVGESQCHVGTRYSPTLVDEIDHATVFPGTIKSCKSLYPASVWKEIEQMDLIDMDVVVERNVLIEWQ